MSLRGGGPKRGAKAKTTDPEPEEDEAGEEDSSDWQGPAPAAKKQRSTRAPAAGAAAKGGRGGRGKKKTEDTEAEPDKEVKAKGRGKAGAASSASAAAAPAKKVRGPPLSSMTRAEQKVEIGNRQAARESIAATENFQYVRRRLPDLPDSSIPDKLSNPHLAPFTPISFSTSLSKIGTTAASAPGARRTGLSPQKAFSSAEDERLNLGETLMKAHGLKRGAQPGVVLHPYTEAGLPVPRAAPAPPPPPPLEPPPQSPPPLESPPEGVEEGAEDAEAEAEAEGGGDGDGNVAMRGEEEEEVAAAEPDEGTVESETAEAAV